MISTLIGILYLVAWIFGIYKTVTSSASLIAKIIWILIILVFGPLGLLVWFFLGPK
jgi:hypothetical protein